MNRRILAASAALILAVLGSVLVLVYAKNADARAIAQAQPTTVWVAQKPIPSGTTLKDAKRTELVTETQVAAKALPVGALQAIDDSNSSLLALSDVQPGEYLLSARFGPKPVGSKAIEVPAGMLAVSVELSDPGRVGKFVTPGTHIAIYDSYVIKSLGTDAAAKALNDANVKGTSVLLDDVLVIGMGDSALAAPTPAPTAQNAEDAKNNGNDAPSFLVTVAVTPEQSLRLVHGIQTGDLYAALRGAEVKIDGKAHVSDLTMFALSAPTAKAAP